MSADVAVLPTGPRATRATSWVAWTASRLPAPPSAAPAPARHGLMLYGSAHLLRLAPKWTAASGEPLPLADGALRNEAAAVAARMADA